MPIQLPEYDEVDNRGIASGRKSLFTRLINSIRCHNIPMVNFFIMLVLGIFLYKLTTKYTNLYMKSSLITIIVTNLVLYGISESLAQLILAYRPNEPLISFKIRDPTEYNPSPIYANSANFLGDAGAGAGNDHDHDHDHDHAFDDTISIDEEGLDRFINYLRRDNEETETREEDFTPAPPVPLTYFQFYRLAGFMCWGFIMGFVQCWWYKFLQIYSKDPKFIEVLRKVMTDQFCFSPISLFCFFTYGTIILENGTWDDTKLKLSKIYLKTLMINYSVWFPVQFFNFLIVPRDFQVPFSSSISVLWNCFLSMRNSSN